ncbi:CDT1-like protein b isoform X1 [Brassica rapa]|uniref:CDT1-like protein b isoform X1 n=1 Tax=Brassica campestris TaxID=3711 RepID=UPI00142D370C|nr:CDT1-like protein b isoform X1 [Brassica rapa]
MSSIENASKKPSMASASSNPETLFSTKTPDKTATLSTRPRDCDKPVRRQILTSPRKPETTVKLPERFEILDECFNGLVTAIRLLKLKGSLTSFANICPKIEYLTNRIFSYDHLAQMKHIYPEATEVKRVLKCDEVTSCMKPTLHINLNTDAIELEDTSCGTKYMQLRNVFYSKLVDFYKAHPKDEFPKELLPESFNFSKKDSDTISVVDVGAFKVENDGFDVQMDEMEQEEDKVNKVFPDSTLSDGTEECLLPNTESTPAKVLSTPSKDLSTPIKLMSATPTLQPSRRCITMTPDDDSDSVRPTNDLERRPSRTRCLNFDTLEEEDGTVSDESNDEANDDEASDASSDEDSDASYDEISLLHSMIEEPKTESIKQNLPKLVNVIHKLFHSTKRTVITKEELLHKMIACQIDIVDRSKDSLFIFKCVLQFHLSLLPCQAHDSSFLFFVFLSEEVEEQLRLMLQLVPDWISETKASFGDVLVSINKMSTPETVRARLEEATSQDTSTVS